MKNIKNNSVINTSNKKAQKGRLPFYKNRGIFLNKGLIGLTTNKSLYIKPLQIKAIKLSISYYLSKKIGVIWYLTSKSPIFKKQGTRMGKGKGKIKNIYYKIPKSFILLQFVLPQQKHDIKINNLLNPGNQIISAANNQVGISQILKLNNLIYEIKRGINKILKKFPFLSVTIKK